MKKLSELLAAPFEKEEARHKAARDAFAEAFAAIKPGSIQYAPNPPLMPPRIDDFTIRLARDVLLKLLDKADSVVCDQDQLAKRAWDIAVAMQKEFAARR